MTLLTFLYMKNVNTGIFKHDPEFIMLDSYDIPLKPIVKNYYPICVWNVGEKCTTIGITSTKN